MACKNCGEDKKIRCNNLCVQCYGKDVRQKAKERMRDMPCKNCGIKVGEWNERGTEVKSLIKGLCSICYYEKNLSVQNVQRSCRDCGIEFIAKKVSPYCMNCKEAHLKRKRIKSEFPKKGDLNPQLYQDMLTLFRRYRDGMATPVDSFRVIDVYLRIFEDYPFVVNSQIDTYSQENQIVLMLKDMKKVYDNE